MKSSALWILERLVSDAGLPAVREVAPASDDGQGLDNRLTIAQLDDGRRVVLRQSRVEPRSPRLRVEFLNGNGVVTPTFYGTDDQGSSLWEYIEGVPLGVMTERGYATDRVWENVGAALARIHNVTFPPPLQGDIGIDAITLRPADPVAGLYARLDDSADWVQKHLPELVSSLMDVRRLVEASADEIRAAKPSVAHGDVNLLNIIVAPDLTANFIDWDFPAVRYPMEELSALDEHAYLHGMDGLPHSFFWGYGAKVPSDLLLAYRIIGCLGWLSSDDWAHWEADQEIQSVARARLHRWHERLMSWAMSIPSRLEALS